jgi:hypothetical protein
MLKVCDENHHAAGDKLKQRQKLNFARSGTETYATCVKASPSRPHDTGSVRCLKQGVENSRFGHYI